MVCLVLVERLEEDRLDLFVQQIEMPIGRLEHAFRVGQHLRSLEPSVSVPDILINSSTSLICSSRS